MLKEFYADIENISDRKVDDIVRIIRKRFPQSDIEIYKTSHKHYNYRIYNVDISFREAIEFIKRLPGIDTEYVLFAEKIKRFKIRVGRRFKIDGNEFTIREAPRIIRKYTYTGRRVSVI